MIYRMKFDIQQAMEGKKRETILVVDDEPANLGVLFEHLRLSGFKVLVAENGASAQRCIERLRPDIVLLDIMLPDIDGFELCSRLTKRKEMSGVPIIFLSALSNTGVKLKALGLKAVDYITKPFDTDEVIIRLEKHLTISNLQKQLEHRNRRLEVEITERKLAEKKLGRYARELKAVNEELSGYAHAVSHDISVPLRAIHNYTNFLLEDLRGTLSGDQENYLHRLDIAVGQAMELVQDLLQLSLIGKQNAAAETTDSGSFLRTLIDSLHLPKETEVGMDGRLPTIEADPTLLKQIFQNLVNNAVKFNTSKTKRIDIGCKDIDKSMIEFFVRDNGIGIDPVFFDRIFRLFDRLHTYEEYQGTGIGLTIVKKAVSRLYGSVRVESKPGEGSTFFIKLPKKQSGFIGDTDIDRPAAALKECDGEFPAAGGARTDVLTARPADADEESVKVYIADDHSVVREGVKGIFARNPRYTIVGEADNGLSAIKEIRVSNPDIVIADINMPVVDGIEATRRILEDFPETKVIILSFHRKLDIAVQAFKAGAKAFVVKDSGAGEIELAADKVMAGNKYASYCITEDILNDYLHILDERQATGPINTLSEREKDILKLVADGVSTRDISEKLCISHATVKNHRNHIMKKLDIHDKAGLVRFAISKGLIGPL